VAKSRTGVKPPVDVIRPEVPDTELTRLLAVLNAPAAKPLAPLAVVNALAAKELTCVIVVF
jgi:hypothetical protein